MTTIGASLASLVVGWVLRHFNIGGGGVVPSPPPVPIPAPTPSTIEQRLALLESQLAALLAALNRPQTPAVPAK